MNKCPICEMLFTDDNILNHIDNYHNFYKRYYDEYIIINSISEFNTRFATIGFEIKEVKNDF